MPLWNIYHTPDVFSSQDVRNQLASAITKLYTAAGLPGFYVVVQFIPLDKGNVFVSAKTRESKPFVRLTVEHMAVHKHEGPDDFPKRFSDRITATLSPFIAEKGYDWEITISDTAREFWRFNGIIPPGRKTDAERLWAEQDRPTVWDQPPEA